MRPRLRAGVGYAWREEGRLHVGPVDPFVVDAHSLVLTGVGSGATRLLETLDGTRDDGALRREAATYGLAPGDVTTILAELAHSRLLVDAGPPRTAARPVDVRPLGELGVSVHGSGRVGSLVASLLAASGVGRVHVHGRGEVTPSDCIPGGAGPADVGRPRTAATVDAVRRTAPRVRTHETPGRAGVSCAVFADGTLPDRALTRSLLRGGTPQLFVDTDGTVGRVGPLVVPGRSPCLVCVRRHRDDVDPSWRHLRLCSPPRSTPRASDARAAAPPGLVARVAGAAVGQVLALLSGGTTETLGTVWELTEASLLPRRQIWPPHPECGCGAAAVPDLPDPGRSGREGSE